jgi:hypothetical protein
VGQIQHRVVAFSGQFEGASLFPTYRTFSAFQFQMRLSYGVQVAPIPSQSQLLASADASQVIVEALMIVRVEIDVIDIARGVSDAPVSRMSSHPGLHLGKLMCRATQLEFVATRIGLQHSDTLL